MSYSKGDPWHDAMYRMQKDAYYNQGVITSNNMLTISGATYGGGSSGIVYGEFVPSVPPPKPVLTATEWLAAEVDKVCARARTL